MSRKGEARASGESERASKQEALLRCEERTWESTESGAKRRGKCRGQKQAAGSKRAKRLAKQGKGRKKHARKEG